MGTVFAYNAKTGEMRVHAEPQGLEPGFEEFETQSVFVPSTDGVRVPMYLVARKGIDRDGNHPVFLTGFAAFGSNSRPGIAPNQVGWIELGGIMAFPQLRGGNTYGEQWVEAGRGSNKPNAVADFIAAAPWLVEQGYTKPERLVVNSGSGGGILSAAAVTRHPELFGAALIDYTMADLIRYEHDDGGTSMPAEYGSPADPEVLTSSLRLEWNGQHYPRGRDKNNQWVADRFAFTAQAIGMPLPQAEAGR